MELNVSVKLTLGFYLLPELLTTHDLNLHLSSTFVLTFLPSRELYFKYGGLAQANLDCFNIQSTGKGTNQ